MFTNVCTSTINGSSMPKFHSVKQRRDGCLKILAARPNVTSPKVAEHQPSVGYKTEERD
jgi:hypothetical protein